MSRLGVVAALCAAVTGLAVLTGPASPVHADPTPTPPVGGCGDKKMGGNGGEGCPLTPPTVAPVTVAVSTTEKVPGSAGSQGGVKGPKVPAPVVSSSESVEKCVASGVGGYCQYTCTKDGVSYGDVTRCPGYVPPAVTSSSGGVGRWCMRRWR